MVIVAGGPAEVMSRVIAALFDVTVKECESFDPGCTVPEKFSVTRGLVGAVVDVAVLEVSVLDEHPAVASAQTAMRQTKVCFTITILVIFYVSEPWRPGEKSTALTAAISSWFTVCPIPG